MNFDKNNLLTNINHLFLDKIKEESNINIIINYLKELNIYLINTINNTKKVILKDGINKEKEIYDLLSLNFNKFEISHIGQSKTKSCDIHMINHEFKKYYLIEIKNKTVITKYDVDKFISDVNSFKHEYDIIGIFLAFTNNIPNIGTFKINNNLIYLTNNFISIEIFTIIFNFYNSNNNNTTIIKYELDESFKSIINNLKIEYSRLNYEITTLTNIYNNTLNNSKDMLNLLNQYELKKIFVEYSLKNINYDNNYEKINIENDLIKKYIQLNPNFTKTELINYFPYFDYLKNMSKKEILEKF